MKITNAQRKALKWLAERGSSGYLDQYGRVNAQGEYLSQGHWRTWLWLLVHGLCAAGDNRITITEFGANQLASGAGAAS